MRGAEARGKPGTVPITSAWSLSAPTGILVPWSEPPTSPSGPLGLGVTVFGAMAMLQTAWFLPALRPLILLLDRFIPLALSTVVLTAGVLMVLFGFGLAKHLRMSELLED